MARRPKIHIVNCLFCKGRGRSPGSNLPCMVCRAKGKTRLEGPTKPCPSCKGAGRRLGEILACFTCCGKGVIEKARKKAVAVRSAQEKIPRKRVLPRNAKKVPRARAQETPTVRKKGVRKDKKKAKMGTSLSLWEKLKTMFK